jgi:hypothetical protein
MIAKSFVYAPLFAGAFLITGCLPANNYVTPSPSVSQSPSPALPKWVYETSKNGKIGGVGISKSHFEGKTAQRSLAISRALDEIARQMGVEVVSLQKISTVGTSQKATTSLESYSFQTTDGKTVRARVETFWEDRAHDELYVWMVME